MPVECEVCTEVPAPVASSQISFVNSHVRSGNVLLLFLKK